MRKLIALAPALLLALLSCSPPPFNLALSQGALTASQMTLAGTIGPINNVSNGMNPGDMVFYPQKDPLTGFTLQAGFVTMPGFGSQQIGYVSSSGSGYQASFQGLMSNQDPPYPGFIVQSLKGGPENIVFAWDSPSVYLSNFKYASMSVVGNVLNPPGWLDLSSLPSFPSSPQIRHASIYPDPDTTYDRMYCLVKSSPVYCEMRYDIKATTSPTNPLQFRSLDLSSVGPTGIPLHALYYYNPNTTVAYATWWSSASSSWVTWSWYDSAGLAVPSRLAGVTHRIDALLTTGELLSTEGGIGRLYDGNGNQEAEFAAASLGFAGEVYVGAEPRLIFSQGFWYDYQLYFNVYTIATSRVKSLH